VFVAATPPARVSLTRLPVPRSHVISPLQCWLVPLMGALAAAAAAAAHEPRCAAICVFGALAGPAGTQMACLAACMYHQQMGSHAMPAMDVCFACPFW
jgi:hypothetical protein